MDYSAPSHEPSLSPWLGIYSFPFQLNNLKAYIIVTMCTILLAFDVSGFALMGDTIRSSIPPGQELIGVSPVVFSAGWRVYGSLAFLAVLLSLAPSAFFVIIIEDTAAGNEDVDWPTDVWYEYLSKIVFLAWVFGCCAAVSTVFWLLAELVLPIPGIYWWTLTLMSALMIFPIPLYSVMIAGSSFILLHPMLLVRFFQKPLAGIALVVHSLVLLLPCVGLGLWMVVSLNWWAAPMVGVVWSTCIFWYARALGRVGYVLSEEKRRAPRRKKRKRARVKKDVPD